MADIGGGDARFEGDLLGEQVARSWSGFGWRTTAGWGVSLWVNTLRNEVSVAVTLRLLCLLFPGIKDPIVFSLSISVNTGEWHGPARSFYMVAVHDFTGVPAETPAASHSVAALPGSLLFLKSKFGVAGSRWLTSLFFLDAACIFLCSLRYPQSTHWVSAAYTSGCLLLGQWHSIQALSPPFLPQGSICCCLCWAQPGPCVLSDQISIPYSWSSQLKLSFY